MNNEEVAKAIGQIKARYPIQEPPEWDQLALEICRLWYKEVEKNRKARSVLRKVRKALAEKYNAKECKLIDNLLGENDDRNESKGSGD